MRVDKIVCISNFADMKKIIITLIILLHYPAFICAFNVPILTDVLVRKEPQQLLINYNIVNYQIGSEVEFNLYNKHTKEMIEVPESAIRGDYQAISEKNSYEVSIAIDSLTIDFSLDNDICMPKLFYQGRIYYEMLKIPEGNHSAIVKKGVIVSERTQEFYISKFEISNEQFAAFILNDGYETYDYWKVREGLMRNTEVGWFFQGKYTLHAPRNWDMDDESLWQNAPSNFICGPVTMMSWFEANAFCHWMGGSLPELSQMQICFAKGSYENSQAYNPVCCDISESGGYQLHFVESNVGEWIINPPDTRASECGPGCKEMFYLLNDNNNFSDYPVVGMSCPLFCNENLGFRFVIIPEN